jgi:hypothetical protein
MFLQFDGASPIWGGGAPNSKGRRCSGPDVRDELLNDLLGCVGVIPLVFAQRCLARRLLVLGSLAHSTDSVAYDGISSRHR